MNTSPKIKFIDIALGVNALLLRYPSTYACTDAFFRIDEIFNHTAKFRKRHYSMEQLRDEYYKRTGHMDYHKTWGGYCVNGRAIFRITENCPDLTIKERELKLICFDLDVGYETKVIACVEGQGTTMDHELAHAFYDQNKYYKLEANTILKKMGSLKCIEKDLKGAGYMQIDLKGETQAYMTGNYKDIQFSKTSLKKIEKYSKYIKLLLIDAKNGVFNY